jgi:2-(3-amino-3-carboxypropyl)histidine synthase
MIVYLADGRFHLESIMIANPSLPAYQYDPFTKQLIRWRIRLIFFFLLYSRSPLFAIHGYYFYFQFSLQILFPSFLFLTCRQYYEFEKMMTMRAQSIETARHARHVGIILGTLGRQGSTAILQV